MFFLEKHLLEIVIGGILLSTGFIYHGLLNMKFNLEKLAAKLNTNGIKYPKLIEENIKFDEELENKLVKIFDRMILRKYIHIFKKFGNLSDDNRKLAKNEFIELVELETSEEEKEILKRRFKDFGIFKYFLLNFFEDRMTKLELLLIFSTKNTSDFKDAELYLNILANEKEYLRALNAFKDVE